jgi:hypothetical protein
VDFALANLGLASVVLSVAADVFGFPVPGDLLAVAGFSILLAMVALYGWGTFYALFAIVHPRAAK